MHHVRTLTKLKGNNEWEKLMLKRHRKTLVVCEDCNSMIPVSYTHLEVYKRQDTLRYGNAQ